MEATTLVEIDQEALYDGANGYNRCVGSCLAHLEELQLPEDRVANIGTDLDRMVLILSVLNSGQTRIGGNSGSVLERLMLRRNITSLYKRCSRGTPMPCVTRHSMCVPIAFQSSSILRLGRFRHFMDLP